ncbi:hypothetical protein GGC64_002886 [Mycobacterium sp. OAS707]|uniref:hypothetical protein n=1 Tax=Mycobacterium sp. OAS707 TaxID=2663822 RepID=UPI001789763A|nr:hypothetical protein [Mycobacterium sp. OAS707]MBE1548862.1 hypothetical protein [Mycobacterium sp. OAS707]
MINTAKLVVTFAAATAATFVATALQTGNPNCSDRWAAWLLIPTLVITVGLVVFPPFHHEGELTPEKFQHVKRWTWAAYALMVAQIAFAAASSVVAVIGLLHETPRA